MPGDQQMQKYKLQTAVGIFLVFGLICIGYMTVKLGHVTLLGDDSYHLGEFGLDVAGKTSTQNHRLSLLHRMYSWALMHGAA